MRFLSVDEVVILCKKTHTKNYRLLDLEKISNYIDELKPSIDADPDKKKKEQFEYYLEIATQALQLLEGGTAPEDIVIKDEIDSLVYHIFLHYGPKEGTPNEKAQMIFKDKKQPYRFFFDIAEIESILNKTDNSDSADVTPFSEDFLQTLQTCFFGEKEYKESFAALKKELNPENNMWPQAFSSYQAYSSIINEICDENTKNRLEKKGAKYHEAAMKIRDVLPLLDSYLIDSPNYEKDWTAVSYLLQFPDLIEPMSDQYHGELAEEITDRWIKSVQKISGLSSLNQAKIVIKTLAPYFDMKISEEKFQDVSEDNADPYSSSGYQNNGNDGYENDPYYGPRPMNPVFVAQFTDLTGAISEFLGNYQKLNVDAFYDAIKRFEGLYQTFPEEMAEMAARPGAIPDYRTKFNQVNSEMEQWYSRVNYAIKLSEKILKAISELQDIDNGEIKLNKEKKASYKKKYLELEKEARTFFGEVPYTKEFCDINGNTEYERLFRDSRDLEKKYCGKSVEDAIEGLSQLENSHRILARVRDFMTRWQFVLNKKRGIAALLNIVKFVAIGFVLLMVGFYVIQTSEKNKQAEQKSGAKDLGAQGYADTDAGYGITNEEDSSDAGSYETQGSYGIVKLQDLEPIISNRIDTELAESYTVGEDAWSDAMLFSPFWDGGWGIGERAYAEYDLGKRFSVLQFAIAPYVKDDYFKDGESAELDIINLDTSKVIYKETIEHASAPKEIALDVNGIEKIRIEITPLVEGYPFCIINEPTLYSQSMAPEGIETVNTAQEPQDIPNGRVDIRDMEPRSYELVDIPFDTTYYVDDDVWIHTLRFRPGNGGPTAYAEYELMNKYSTMDFKLIPEPNADNFGESSEAELKIIDLASSKELYSGSISYGTDLTDTIDVSGVTTLRIEIDQVNGFGYCLMKDVYLYP